LQFILALQQTCTEGFVFKGTSDRVLTLIASAQANTQAQFASNNYTFQLLLRLHGFTFEQGF
jgi:hypothetical protein